MYRYLDTLLRSARKKIQTEFNKLSVTGFDELNVIGTQKTTQAMFDRFLSDNEAMYLKVGKDAYKNAVGKAKDEGFSGKESNVDSEWIAGVLGAYNLVTGYLYGKEADRKRMRLNEQILTAREYDNRTMYHDSLRKTANLWYTQTVQYGISVVDETTIKGFEDMGVKEVRWVAADDEKTCPTCGSRDNKVYKVREIPPKPHYQCRCQIVPIKAKE